MTRGRLFGAAMAVICLLLASVTAAQAAPPAADLRAANPRESASMAAQLAKKYMDSEITIKSARVTPTEGVGVAYAEVDYAMRIAVFTVYPDGESILDYVASGVECGELHAGGIDDITSETLGIAGADYCSQGLPRFLKRARVNELKRIRDRANATVDAINRCKTNRCVRKRYRERYWWATSRLIVRSGELTETVSWSRCTVGLEGVHDSAKAHRKALSAILRANARNDFVGEAIARGELKDASKQSKSAWSTVRAECIDYTAH